jgi:hypothetical protein
MFAVNSRAGAAGSDPRNFRSQPREFPDRLNSPKSMIIAGWAWIDRQTDGRFVTQNFPAFFRDSLQCLESGDTHCPE